MKWQPFETSKMRLVIAIIPTSLNPQNGILRT